MVYFYGVGKESVKVLKIQKRVLHSIKGLHKRVSCRPIFKELKVLNVTALCSVDLHKKNVYLGRNSDVYECNTRRKCDFHVPSCNTRTSLFKRSVMNMGIRLYNKMPTRINQLDSFRDFK